MPVDVMIIDKMLWIAGSVRGFPGFATHGSRVAKPSDITLVLRTYLNADNNNPWTCLFDDNVDTIAV